MSGNLVEECQGCPKIDWIDNTIDKAVCPVYPNPEVQMRWVKGKTKFGCGFNTATHNKAEKKDKKKLNPIKASKKARRRK